MKSGGKRSNDITELNMGKIQATCLNKKQLQLNSVRIAENIL